MLHVTPTQFEAITCNRCGTCCEGLVLPTPIGRRVTEIEALAFIVDLLPWALHDCDEGMPIYRVSRQDRRFGHGHGEREHHAPVQLQFHARPDAPFPERRPCEPAHREWHGERVRLVRWLLELEPAGVDAAGKSRWACPRFVRGDDGLGVCTQYEERPRVCSDFPYNFAQRQYPDCSWNVKIIGVGVCSSPSLLREAARAVA